MAKVRCVPLRDNNWHTTDEIPADGSLIQFGFAANAIVNPANIVKVDFEEGNWKHQVTHWRYWRKKYARTIMNDNRMQL